MYSFDSFFLNGGILVYQFDPAKSPVRRGFLHITPLRQFSDVSGTYQKYVRNSAGGVRETTVCPLSPPFSPLPSPT